MDEEMQQAEQEKEDAFYRKKVSQSAEPFVHICDGAYVDRPEDVTQIRILSNQKEVSLYKDGQLMETQTGDQVFLFRVPIEGEHSIEAKAGDCKSVILVRKVGRTDRPEREISQDGGTNGEKGNPAVYAGQRHEQ